MSKGDTLLFVYGTLKRGDVRAPLLDGQQYVAETRTKAYYRLFDTGTYPALVEATPLGLAGRAIHGELWRVDAACLHRLDEEEGVEEGLYERRLIKINDNESSAESYFYLLPVTGMKDCGECWP